MRLSSVLKKISILFVLLLPAVLPAQHRSSRDTGVYYIDGERISGGDTSARPAATVSRKDLQKIPFSGKSVEAYRPLKIYKWWQWRKKHRLRKQLKRII